MAVSASQTGFLSSGQALEQLVAQESGQRSASVRRWAILAGVGAGVAGVSIYGLVASSALTSGVGLAIYDASILGTCLGGIGFLFGGAMLADQLGWKKGDGSAIHLSGLKNGDYHLTNKPSLGDRISGLSPVAPVEDVQQLARHDGSFVIINGVHIRAARGVYPSVVEWEGNFNGSPIKLLADCIMDGTRLLGQEGKSLYVIGRVENVEKGVLSLRRYGPALAAPTAGRPN